MKIHGRREEWPWTHEEDETRGGLEMAEIAANPAFVADGMNIAIGEAGQSLTGHKFCPVFSNNQGESR